MAITDLNCPNCGASVDFAGSTRATCSFCKSQLYLTDDGVETSSVLHDLVENQPATRSVDQALQIINSDPAVVQAFGKPITPGPFVTGKISGGDTSSSARFSVPIYGPKRNGDLQVSGSWRKGIWDLSVYVVYDEDGEEQTIQITQKVK